MKKILFIIVLALCLLSCEKEPKSINLKDYKQEPLTLSEDYCGTYKADLNRGLHSYLSLDRDGSATLWEFGKAYKGTWYVTGYKMVIKISGMVDIDKGIDSSLWESDRILHLGSGYARVGLEKISDSCISNSKDLEGVWINTDNYGITSAIEFKGDQVTYYDDGFSPSTYAYAIATDKNAFKIPSEFYQEYFYIMGSDLDIGGIRYSKIKGWL